MRPVASSALSLLGLIRHMTEVERAWFRFRFAGQRSATTPYSSEQHPDADFDFAAAADAEAGFAAFAAECAAADDAAGGHSLDETFVHPRTHERMDLRWIYLHMIEEYARHNGHADLIRELVDGATGD
jgi:uncharacterized damage-inducible protein DinB